MATFDCTLYPQVKMHSHSDPKSKARLDQFSSFFHFENWSSVQTIWLSPAQPMYLLSIHKNKVQKFFQLKKRGIENIPAKCFRDISDIYISGILFADHRTKSLETWPSNARSQKKAQNVPRKLSTIFTDFYMFQETRSHNIYISNPLGTLKKLHPHWPTCILIEKNLLNRS